MSQSVLPQNIRLVSKICEGMNRSSSFARLAEISRIVAEKIEVAMGGRIDKQMMKDFKTLDKQSNAQGQKINEQDTLTLINRAKTLNGTYTSSCFGTSENKGTKDLKNIMRQHEDRFSPESRAAISNFLRTGNAPRYQPTAPSMNTVRTNEGGAMPAASASPVSPVFSDRGGASVPASVGGRTHRRDVMNNAGPAPSNNTASGAYVPGVANRPGRISTEVRREAINPSSPLENVGANDRANIVAAGRGIPSSGAGRTDGTNISPSAPPPSTPAASDARPNNTNANPVSPAGTTRPEAGAAPATAPTNIGGPTGVTTPFGVRILDFQASKPTWNCHWFPIQENRPNGDPVNNLYAKNGALDKLDKLTGKSSQSYEFAHHRKGISEGKQYSWWGHCNDAAQSACAFKEPKRAVTRKALDGSQVNFTINDIQGLLVKASSSLIQKVDFKGRRFNAANRDDMNDPKPDMFIGVMQEWAKDGLPFVLDIDRGPQVWNFPYDKVQIDETDKAPQGFNAESLPSDGSVKYYHIHMSGTGYGDKVRNYECYVQRDAQGNAVASGWIKTPNTHNNPDFMWRPHPMANLYDKASWQLRGKPSNPEIDMQVIYDIYMESIA